MNVNELADMIEFDAPIHGINKEAATMLRQLQAECDRLYRIIELNYTMKELTDAEIDEIWREFDDRDADDWFVAITRAILRKAQEK